MAKLPASANFAQQVARLRARLADYLRTTWSGAHVGIIGFCVGAAILQYTLLSGAATPEAMLAAVNALGAQLGVDLLADIIGNRPKPSGLTAAEIAEAVQERLSHGDDLPAVRYLLQRFSVLELALVEWRKANDVRWQLLVDDIYKYPEVIAEHTADIVSAILLPHLTSLDARLACVQELLARRPEPGVSTQSRKQSLNQELDQFLTRAVAEYQASTYQAALAVPQAPLRPYKFLYAYDLQDTSIFFGRELASRDLYDTILATRLTILHAKSGVGKTSLLNAGLSPLLLRNGLLPLHVRVYDDPVSAVKEAIAPHSQGPWPSLLPALTLQEFLGLTCGLIKHQSRELVVMLDQMETFFILNPDRSQREPFIHALADCCQDDALPIRIVIAIRKDYYSDLADFSKRLPHIFHNHYRLDPLTRDEALQAITAPVAKLNPPVTYEPALLDALVRDLSRVEIELPHLQIVCSTLHSSLPCDQRQISLSQYNAMGEAEGILGAYLNDTLNNLPPAKRDLARAILIGLVTSRATGRALSRPTLAARVSADPDPTIEVLAYLVDARLVRRDEVGGEVVYEMAHDCLVDEISTWIDPQQLDFKKAEELLSREVATWLVHGTLIPIDRMELLRPHRERFRALEDSAWECILHSALYFDYEAKEWARAAGDAGRRILHASLSYTDAPSRRRAAELLGTFKDGAAVDSLISALADANPAVACAAARALGSIHDPRCIDALVQALVSHSPGLSLAAIEALARLGEPATEALVIALQAPLPNVRAVAAKALVTIGKPAVPLLVSLLESDAPRGCTEAATALARIGDSALSPLLSALANHDPDLRLAAAQALGELRDELAVQPLILALQDTHIAVRRAATAALGHLGNELALQPLILALQDTHIAVRRAATAALGHLCSVPQAVALGHDDPATRCVAAEALSAVASECTKPVLVAALRDEAPSVRLAALRSLGKLTGVSQLVDLGNDHWWVRRQAIAEFPDTDQPWVIQAVVSALWDADDDVRSATIPFLQRLPAPAAQALATILLDEQKHVRSAAARALGRLGDSSGVPPLVAALTDPVPEVRREAADALTRVRPVPIGALAAALQHSDGVVRATAARGLGRRGESAALDALIPALHDPHPAVRKAAIVSLGIIGNALAVRPLVGLLRDLPDVAQPAAQALGAIGQPATTALLEALRHGDDKVRVHAADALGLTGDERAIDDLISALTDEARPVCLAATRALGRLWRIRHITALGEEDSARRQAAAGALLDISYAGRLEPLLAALDDHDAGVRAAIVTVLGRTANPTAIDPLRRALRDPSASVRRAAIRGLGHLWRMPILVTLGQEDRLARREAAKRLGRCPDLRAAEPLTALLMDDFADAQEAAATALRAMGLVADHAPTTVEPTESPEPHDNDPAGTGE